MNLARINKKHPHEDGRTTLHAMNEKRIKEITDYYATLPEKINQLDQLNKKYKSIRNNVDVYSIKVKIKNLEKEISEITNKSELSDYLLNASYFLEEYKNSNRLEEEVEEVEESDESEEIEEEEEEKECEEITIPLKKTSTLSNDDFKITKSNKGQILNRYIYECLGEGIILSNVNDSSYLKCAECNVNRIINHKEAIAICVECGSTVNYQDNNICNEFSEEIEVLSPFSYKKLNHLKEQISQSLAKESTPPPQEVIDIILLELKIDRINDKKDVTPQRVRMYLRKKGLNKMYEHIPAIIHKICGTSPPDISRELENQFIKMFEEIQIPYEKYKPKYRKNFLSYSYCLHKFCQILGHNELLYLFTLLKSREKLKLQDEIFSKICAEKGWPFIPSL